MRVMVTGATGFAGRPVVDALLARGFVVRAALRGPALGGLSPQVEACAIGDIVACEDWSGVLRGVEVVVHLAARVHVMRDRAADPMAAFYAANVAATRRLARSCVDAGVRLFVYASSIKVNGEATAPDRRFDERSEPAPEDAYGRSKWEAERMLRDHAGLGLDVTVLRPPLMYGPGVKGNMRSLIRAIECGLPLPFGGVDNVRSLLGVRNFADAVALTVACQSPRPSGRGVFRTYLLSDGEDLSTPELIRLIAKAGGWRPRLPRVPTAFLRLAGRLSGRADEVARICGSLLVDSSLIGQELGWQPPMPVEDGISEMVESYRADRVGR